MMEDQSDELPVYIFEHNNIPHTKVAGPILTNQIPIMSIQTGSYDYMMTMNCADCLYARGR